MSVGNTYPAMYVMTVLMNPHYRNGVYIPA